jgi:hypothetical protein
MHRRLSIGAVLAIAGVLLAQLAAPSPSAAQTYSGTGTPAIPGTRTPEQSPATAAPAPVPTANPPAPAGSSPAIGSGTSAPAPGLSFGAAPAPLVSPNR